MGMPKQITITSSIISPIVNLDWASAKFTTWAVTGSSSGAFTYVVEGTVDDVQQTASPTWFALSSATTTNSSINLYQGPLGGRRLNASAVSSAALTLKVLQGIGW